MPLTGEQKSELLRIARDAIRCDVEHVRVPSLQSADPMMNRLSGVFVTLHAGDELRGCIGFIEPVYPLARATQEVAVKAALEDPRFDPVGREEIADISIEVSVLSRLVELTDPAGVRVGEHGLVIESGMRRGLLLPQVAVEYGWDREQFLSHTARKANLPADAWKRPGVKLFTFTVEKFSEKELHAAAPEL
jgi:AmmeMemoRadiSam system protein A